MVSAITEAAISTVNGVGRILYLRPFNEHVGTSVTDGPNIQDIVRGSRAFRTTSAEIGGKVEADFAEAEVHMLLTVPLLVVVVVFVVAVAVAVVVVFTL